MDGGNGHRRGRQMVFFDRMKRRKKFYDKGKMKPVLHCSICNGEQIAGFQEFATGKFQEVMLIRDSRDLERFREEYGIEGEIEKIY